MIYERELLEHLEELDPISWNGIVYRHMFAGYPPDRANTRGARWNPPDVRAIYASLERETALAEVEYQLSVQPFPPVSRRDLYRIKVTLSSVIDLRDMDSFGRLGIQTEVLAADDHTGCQSVGGAVAFLGYDGLLVPSVRIKNGSNLVIFPHNQVNEESLEILDSERLSD